MKTVGVDVFGDLTYESGEVFAFILSNPVNVLLGGPAATVTVLNDDLVPQIAVDHPSSAEGDIGTTTATFTFSLSNPSAFPITADHATVDATAWSPDDFAASTGTLSFAPGETTKTLDVRHVTADEADTVSSRRSRVGSRRSPSDVFRRVRRLRSSFRTDDGGG